MQRFLEDSDSLVVSLKLFQSVLECFGSLRKRPRAFQEIWDVSGKALQRSRMPKCLHMARRSRASHSSVLPQVLVKIIPITSIANGAIVAILSLVTLSETTIQTISIARGEPAPSC